MKAALQEQRRPSGQPKDKRFLRGNCSRAEQQQALAESPRPQFPCGLLSAFQPTEPGSESWGETQEEATKFNNSSSDPGEAGCCLGLRRLREKAHLNQIQFFKTMLGLEFRLVLHLQSWS